MKDSRDPEAIGQALLDCGKARPDMKASERYDKFLEEIMFANYGESDEDFHRRVEAHYASRTAA